MDSKHSVYRVLPICLTCQTLVVYYLSILRGLVSALTQFIAEIMALDVEPEAEEAGKVDCPSSPEGCSVAVMLSEQAAQEDAKTDTYVPRHQYGAIGGAALVVRSQVYKHVLIGRIHMTIAKTNDECGTIISYGIG